MYTNKKMFQTMTAAAIALAILSGCGNNSNANNAGASSPSATQPGVSSPSAEPGQTTTPPSASFPASPSPSSSQPSADPAPNPDELKASDITTKLTSDIEMGALLTLDAQGVKDMYGLDVTAYADSMFMPAMMNISSAEIAVVKLKTDKQYDEVKAAMENRAKAIQKTFEQYLQDQYQASKNYQILRSGDFVLFSITKDQEKVKEIFEGFFAK